MSADPVRWDWWSNTHTHTHHVNSPRVVRILMHAVNQWCFFIIHQNWSCIEWALMDVSTCDWVMCDRDYGLERKQVSYLHRTWGWEDTGSPRAKTSTSIIVMTYTEAALHRIENNIIYQAGRSHTGKVAWFADCIHQLPTIRWHYCIWLHVTGWATRRSVITLVTATSVPGSLTDSLTDSLISHHILQKDLTGRVKGSVRDSPIRHRGAFRAPAVF